MKDRFTRGIARPLSWCLRAQLRTLTGAVGLSLLLAAHAHAAGVARVQTVFDSVDQPGAIESIALSPDGAHVYVAAPDAGALRVFLRDALSGGLVTVEAQALTGVAGIAISPDGAFVYAASEQFDQITVYARNASTGRLTVASTVRDNQGGVDGLDGVHGIAVSPNGGQLYAAGATDNAVAMFTRNPTTGALGFLGLLRDSVAGVDGLAGARDVAVSADGLHVYVAGALDNAIAVFARDNSTGLLTFSAPIYQDGVGGVDGLASVAALRLSGDGAHLYAASPSDNAVALFSRNAGTGALTFVSSTVRNTGAGILLGGARALALSPSGSHVYVAAASDDAIVAFARNAGTGALTLVESAVDGALDADTLIHVDGIDGARAVAVSTDAADVYAGGFPEDAVAVFARNGGTGALEFTQVKYGSEPNGADGLLATESLCVSPDGANLYATGLSDDAVTVFSRSAGTGRLTFIEVERDGAPGVSGLDGASGVAISPDGDDVYVAAANDDGVVLFRRNATGALLFNGSKRNGDVEPPSGPTVSGLAGAHGIAVEPTTGTAVYVAGASDSALVLLQRNPATGALTFAQALVDGAGGIDGLDGVTRVAISPDGAHVYTAASGDNAVDVFTRSVIDSTLSLAQVVLDGAGGVDGISGAADVAVSPDGKHVYVAGQLENAVAVFARNASTGQLTFVEAERDGVAGVDGLLGPTGVSVGADGAHVYVTGQAENALAVFNRDATTGQITFVEVERDGVAGVDGLQGAAAVTTSADALHVYTAAALDSALTVLRVIRCGDTFNDNPEECDDGNTNNGDGCDANCTLPRCGNHIVDAGEICDDGGICVGGSNNGSACVASTECPGGTCRNADGDGCDSNCTPTACGNGVVTAGEACDDGDTDNNDECVITNLGGVPGPTNCAAARCGDGFRCSAASCTSGRNNQPEVCDDGNINSGDGCDSNCTVTACGNGVVTAGEGCDDGDADNTDECVITNVGGVPGPTNCVVASCGDGFTCSATTCTSGRNHGPEQCDDTNAVDGDGCDSNCSPTSCGNGIVTAGETCDDGNANNGDTCVVANPGGPPGPANCVSASCGDGFTCTDAGCSSGPTGGAEQCDGGDPNDPDDNCTRNCALECGNGVIDGSCIAGDVGRSCTTNADCDTSAGAGDGICRREDCEPGGTSCTQLGACSDRCFFWSCGNGVKECNEACDLGSVLNNTPGSTCTSACLSDAPASCRAGFAGWRALDPQKPRRKRFVCHDGDTCDDDGPTPDGKCTFHVNLCLGIQPPPNQSATCRPARVRSVDLVGLKPGVCWQEQAAAKLTAEVQSFAAHCSAGQVGQSCVYNPDCDTAPSSGDGICQATVPLRCKNFGRRGHICSVDRDCDHFLGSGDGVCGFGTGVEFEGPLSFDDGPACTNSVSLSVPIHKSLRLRARTFGNVANNGNVDTKLRRDFDRLRLVCGAARGDRNATPAPACDPTPTPAGP